MNKSKMDARVQKAEDTRRYVKYPITAILEALFADVLVSTRPVPVGWLIHVSGSQAYAQVGGSGEADLRCS